jgi:integrase
MRRKIPGRRAAVVRRLQDKRSFAFSSYGGDLAKLQSQTGHQSLDTLQIYLHLANDKAVAKESERVNPLKNLGKKAE